MSNQSKEPEKIELKLIWPLDDNLQAVYANQFAISNYGPEVVITFAEFLPSSFANRSKQEIEEYLKNAHVKPVAKVIISREGLDAFFGLLKNYVETNLRNEE